MKHGHWTGQRNINMQQEARIRQGNINMQQEPRTGQGNINMQQEPRTGQDDKNKEQILIRCFTFSKTKLHPDLV